jgi:DNA-binding MarR family transcriptional regulator
VSDPAELNFGLLLFIPYRFMESAVLDLVRRHGHHMSLSQARVFQRIDAEGSRLSHLAEAAQLPKQTVGSIVDQLEEAGYVRRVPDPDDARARLVVVAEKGRAAIELATPVVEDIEASWRSHLGEARFAELRRSLEELVAITDLDRSNIR